MAVGEVSEETREGVSQRARSLKTRNRVRSNPLSPGVYLLRNAGKTLPLTAVIVLAVMLVAGIITLINSIPFSIRTIYAYSRQMVGITPRGDSAQTRHLVAEVKKGSPVPLDRVMICRASSAQVQSIVGKWPFVVLGLSQSDMRYYLGRMGATQLVGRLPRPGKAEAVISSPVAQNLGLHIYNANEPKALRDKSIILGPEKSDDYSPYYVRVVGIANTNQWMVVDPIEYQRANHFPPIDLAMIFAKNLHDQNILDHWAAKRFKGQRAQVYAFFQIEKNTREMFHTLYTILDVVIATLALVITLMMGMLMNIYQSQRLVEFGLLQAIGYTKKRLLRRVLAESLVVVVGGWLLGIAAAYGLLLVAKSMLMDPKAFAMNPMDPLAFRYTVPLPVAILLVATATVYLRFRRFDPVGVVERRVV